jgi:hypothetical protein
MIVSGPADSIVRTPERQSQSCLGFSLVGCRYVTTIIRVLKGFTVTACWMVENNLETLLTDIPVH